MAVPFDGSLILYNNPKDSDLSRSILPECKSCNEKFKILNCRQWNLCWKWTKLHWVSWWNWHSLNLLQITNLINRLCPALGIYIRHFSLKNFITDSLTIFSTKWQNSFTDIFRIRLDCHIRSHPDFWQITLMVSGNVGNGMFSMGNYLLWQKVMKMFFCLHRHLTSVQWRHRGLKRWWYFCTRSVWPDFRIKN